MIESTVPLRTPLFRGERRLRIALVGMPNAGKSTLFNAVSRAPRRREFGPGQVQEIPPYALPKWRVLCSETGARLFAA